MDAVLTFPDRIEDRDALDGLLREYYETVLPRLAAVGGPLLHTQDLMPGVWACMGDYLPPDGVTVLAHDPGRDLLVGCGFLRQIAPETGELKRLYVRPEAQGAGLGRRLVTSRIRRAREMGLRWLMTDTVRGNTPMLNLYASLGFVEVPRYTGNANDPELDPWLVYLSLDLDDRTQASDARR